MKRTLNARELGREATIDSLRQLLVEEFQVASSPDKIAVDQPLFSASVGLSSLEGIELLTLVEKRFGVRIENLDDWIDDSPSIDSFARYLIDNSPLANAAPSGRQAGDAVVSDSGHRPHGAADSL